MNGNFVVTAQFALLLAGALDGPGLVWTTAGTGQPWFGQTTTTHDGTDAAQSGTTPAGQSASISTSVTGPGGLGFWWKCSCRSNNDFLRCSVDGVEQASRTGVQDWANVSLTLTEGTHTVVWTYARGATAPFGNDAAWLDQVVFDDDNNFEGWRASRFTPEELTDIGISGPAADPDHDGVSNYLEYAFDSPPKTFAPNAPSLPVLVTVPVSSVLHNALRFTRPIARVGRVSYQAWWSEDLVTWAPFGAEEITGGSSGVQTVTIVDPLPADGALVRFYRLAASELTPP